MKRVMKTKGHSDLKVVPSVVCSPGRGRRAAVAELYHRAPL